MHIIGQVLRLSQSQLNPISSLTLANPLLSMIPNRFCVEFSLPGSSVHPTQITCPFYWFCPPYRARRPGCSFWTATWRQWSSHFSFFSLSRQCTGEKSCLWIVQRRWTFPGTGGRMNCRPSLALAIDILGSTAHFLAFTYLWTYSLANYLWITQYLRGSNSLKTHDILKYFLFWNRLQVLLSLIV